MAEALKHCSRSDCEPLEQVRGDMRPGAYYDLIESNRIPRVGYIEDAHLYGVIQGAPDAEKANPIHIIEAPDPDTLSDFRICCKTCGKATGWQRSDAPGMPGAGRDFTRKKWNEST